ncbi:hypothetical protein J2X72_004384 [Phyllobacterium sp. 1468]|nr:hypothetical protein [Phyllobacterium sp. 1468]
MLRYDLGSRPESVQEARFDGGIDDREEVDEHERRGRDTELAVKRNFSSRGFNGFMAAMVALLSIVKLKLA